jgi:cell fate (sporulation/competence/biofilm development) regulator YlbF (YheA/YmcA/DUF963 family)
MTVYDMARELAEKLLETPEGKAVTEKRAIFDNDEQAQERLREYNLRKASLNEKVKAGYMTAEQIENATLELKGRVEELKNDEVIGGMAKAEAEFSEIVNSVINVFQATLNGESEFSQNGCSGNCSGCSGCH